MKDVHNGYVCPLSAFVSVAQEGAADEGQQDCDQSAANQDELGGCLQGDVVEDPTNKKRRHHLDP